MENSGRRDELRVHVYNDVSRRLVTETFPVHLADGQWHQVAISVTRSSHVQLHVDCHLSYERPLAISPRHLGTLLNAPRAHPRLWIGQRALGDNLLKVSEGHVCLITLLIPIIRDLFYTLNRDIYQPRCCYECRTTLA